MKMNKKEWFELALSKIDAMSKSDFEAAWNLAMAPLPEAVEVSCETFSGLERDIVDGFFDATRFGSADSSIFENEWLPLSFKTSNTAPQEALFTCLAA